MRIGQGKRQLFGNVRSHVNAEQRARGWAGLPKLSSHLAFRVRFIYVAVDLTDLLAQHEVRDLLFHLAISALI